MHFSVVGCLCYLLKQSENNTYMIQMLNEETSSIHYTRYNKMIIFPLWCAGLKTLIVTTRRTGTTSVLTWSSRPSRG